MKELICIMCPKGCRLNVDDDLNLTGNGCIRGITYGKQEITDPRRYLTSTVKLYSKYFTTSLTLSLGNSPLDITGNLR